MHIFCPNTVLQKVSMSVIYLLDSLNVEKENEISKQPYFGLGRTWQNV